MKIHVDFSNAEIAIVIPIISQFFHLVPLFSLPSPLVFQCGQQAFSLLSVESAKHSHFGATDRQELADSVELLLKKRERY